MTKNLCKRLVMIGIFSATGFLFTSVVPVRGEDDGAEREDSAEETHEDENEGEEAKEREQENEDRMEKKREEALKDAREKEREERKKLFESQKEDRERKENFSTERVEKEEEESEEQTEKLCAKLLERGAKTSDRLSERVKKMLERKEKRLTVFDEKRSERDEKLAGLRTQRQEKREEMYRTLLEKAGDDPKKRDAVNAFRLAVEDAIAKRTSAVDAAKKTFRTGVDAAIGSKKMTMEGSVARFQSASEQAFLAARRDCESGVPAKEVRDQLRSSLDVARNATRDDRAASLTVGARVKALAEAQRTAFQKALEEFKTSVDRARAELKAAFDAPIEMGAPEQPKARSLEKE